ncbi:MAG: hypothetical protein Q8L77_15715 [Nitrospirota bacterium]|nr:hypothetical protein [Nitrospirota bacterium]
MIRLIPALVVAFVVLAALASGCIPRHPPHTPQPVPEVPNQEVRPADQRS